MADLEFEQEKVNEQEQTFGTRLEVVDPENPKIPDFDDIDGDIEVPPEDAIVDEEESNGQLNLFGDDEPAPKKKPAAKKPASSPKKAAPEQKVGREYAVFYAGHHIPVPEDNMDLDRLRQFLEMDFPELSKERTEMLIDKEKQQVVPVVKGSKKG